MYIEKEECILVPITILKQQAGFLAIPLALPTKHVKLKTKTKETDRSL
jgi:hypothetical protein